MPRTLNTYEQLLQYAESIAGGTISEEIVEIGEGLNIRIKISGETWDGSIDYRLAKFVLSTQKSINKLIDDLNIELLETDTPIIKFRIEAGCSLIEVQLSPIIKAILNKMTGRQLTITAIIAILVISGYFTTSRILEYKEKLAAANAQQQQQKEMLSTINMMAEKLPDYERPMRVLANSLEENDTVETSVTGDLYTKDEIKKEYPGKGKYKPQTIYIDGTYTVVAIKIDAGVITLEKGDHRIDCQSSLNDLEAEQLFSKIQKATKEGKGFELNFKITADYYKGTNQIKRPVIYEIGEPRDGAVDIAAVFK